MRQALFPALMAVVVLTGGAWAQPASRPGSPPARPTQAPAEAPPAAGANEPERTTASFGDWILRCERPAGGQALCEAAQIVSANNQAVAQFAFARPGRGEPLRLTVLVPHNVGFGAAPRLAAPDGTSVPPVELAWRRCLPVGCLADAPAGDAVARLRTRTEQMRLTFQDGAGREIALPFSPRGLSAALDALESGAR
ncbi:invasion associated locus B family protein [Roseomonas sp. CCTCC AB2023176]|uniref:invasion associated locus B family protein n=1 Tax=Roseomonas sp. CCTCC AB2023176 TaxID=3342640 RepID=UPI0035D6C306